MLSTYPNPPPPPQQPSPLPRRIDSLNSISTQPKLANPLVQSREDAKYARVVLTASVKKDEEKASLQSDNEEEHVQRRHDDHICELTEALERMTGWVEELASLLQQSYKNHTELETALTLARSNLQLALANNEMLEEALKRGGGGGQDIGWRRWSEREGVRRSGSVQDYVHPDRPASVADAPQQQQQHQQSAPSRFFSFKSSLQRISNTNTSPTATSASPPYASASASASASSLLSPITIPSSSRGQSRAASPAPGVASVATPDPSSSRSPSPTHTNPITHHSHSASASLSQPSQLTPREKELTSQLNKERAALKALAAAKTQLEDELESLSQALFEEANKMVSKANRKLAETEEELHIAMEQKEALQGALRIVEGENGALRGAGGSDHGVEVREEQSTPRAAVKQLTRCADASRPDDVDKMDVSPQQISQPRLTHPTLPLHLPVRPTIPAVAVTDQRPATTINKTSFWSPVTPSSDSGEGEGRDAQKSLSRPLISRSLSPSPESQPGPVQVPSQTSPAHPFNLNLPPPTSTIQPTLADPAAKPVHRWSVLPATPRSRNAVRSEFEDAMRRMRELVGDDADEDEEDKEGGSGEKEQGERDGEGEYSAKKKGSDVEAKHRDGGVSPWRT